MNNTVLYVEGRAIEIWYNIINIVLNIKLRMREVKQSVCLSVVVVVVVVVVVGTKIARSRVLGIYASCKHNQSVDIGEKLVCTFFELLKKAY